MDSFRRYLEGMNQSEVEILKNTLEFMHKYYSDLLSDEAIESYFEQIKNKLVRINDLDKQWVACVTDPNEVNTVVNAISKILEDTIYSIGGLAERGKIEYIIEKICNSMQKKGIVDKPRIPFYILVLSQLKING